MPLAATAIPGIMVRAAASVAVDEVGVGRAGDVGRVRRVHPHPAPHPPLLEQLVGLGEQPRGGLPLVVEIARLLLELPHDDVRVHRAVVAEHDHMLARRDDRVGPFRVDHDRTVIDKLLLKPEWL